MNRKFSLILTVVLGISLVCGCSTEENTQSGITEREQVVTENTVEILTDLNFSKGFNASQFVSSLASEGYLGIVDYGGGKADGDPDWILAQWGCTHNIADGTYSRADPVISCDDGGKYIEVDTSGTGAITLGIRGSEEYTKDNDGNVRERTDSTENWPHILIEQTIDNVDTLSCSHLYMEIEYTVTKCESLVDRSIYPLNEEINAAQFNWYISLMDNDPESESYGEKMWFGLSLFDTRYIDDCVPASGGYDNGKEDSTGYYIYCPSLKKIASNEENTITTPTSVLNQTVSVKVDILPQLTNALSVAKKTGALTGASLENLIITTTNIGWELPGNYDAEVAISYMNIYKEA